MKWRIRPETVVALTTGIGSIGSILNRHWKYRWLEILTGLMLMPLALMIVSIPILLVAIPIINVAKRRNPNIKQNQNGEMKK